MESLIIHPTPMAQWKALVDEAEKASSIQLPEELESYLVFLLMRFSDHPELVNSVLAIDFLKSLEKIKFTKQEGLKDVGDKCLLFAGLFPGQARRHRLRISYYVKLGKTAYISLADSYLNHFSQLFTSLSDQFVGLMDILHTMHELTSQQYFLDLLQAEELWSDTKSPHAFKTLRANTQGFLIPGEEDNPIKH